MRSGRLEGLVQCARVSNRERVSGGESTTAISHSLLFIPLRPYFPCHLTFINIVDTIIVERASRE